MRGVLGILFIGLGLYMAYAVLSGRFPSAQTASGPAPSILNPGQSASQISHGNQVITGSNGAHGVGSTFGLPTMANLNDLPATVGGPR